MGDERVKLDALDDLPDAIAAHRSRTSSSATVPPTISDAGASSPVPPLVATNQHAQSAPSATTTSCTTPLNTPSAGSGASTPAAAPRLTYEALEQLCRNVEDELQTLRETELRLKQQNTDSVRRERILTRRLALKEQEIQDYSNQIAEYKTSQVPAPASLRAALLDPAVNILLQKLKAELQATRARLEDTQNELSAWKFTPDSNTGKRLMAKCRLLYTENEELGKMTSNGRLAKLEGDLALQKSFSEEVKKSQSELDDFLQELDEDVEGMQSTILFLQQELKTSKETIGHLETQLVTLKHTANPKHQPDPALADTDDTDQIAVTNGNRMHDNNDDVSPNGATTPNTTVLPGESDPIENDDPSKPIDHTRVLRKDNAASHTIANVVPASGKTTQPTPRTLRSSSRHISSDDVRKVNYRNVRNGNSEVNDEVLDDDEVAENDEEVGDQDAAADDASGGGAALVSAVATVHNNGSANRKRSYDGEESDSSEHGVAPETELTTSTVGNSVLVNHKKFTKRVRRASVLSMDLNEEDSRIEFDTDRTLRETANGNGSIAEA